MYPTTFENTPLQNVKGPWTFKELYPLDADRYSLFLLKTGMGWGGTER